ncbi:MAG TPA: TIGR02300 family protein [Pseudolabrys sp.]|nr:TIGR02300 family protein [Pseudolabrys sp.]
MAKPELGTKRLCASCGAKFYDLNKDPIVCPKCETVFVVPVVTTRATRADTARAGSDQETTESAGAEFISLEDADAEAQGKKKAAVKDDDLEDDDDADADAGDDDAFIEEADDGEDDVTDIIGDAGDKEDEN